MSQDNSSESSSRHGITRRRTRKDMNGRDSLCIFCGRGYLKNNALVKHVRQKHADEHVVHDFLESLRQRKKKVSRKKNLIGL